MSLPGAGKTLKGFPQNGKSITKNGALRRRLSEPDFKIR